MIALMTRKEKSPLAKRLTKYRKAAGFASPEQLAKAIDNPAITKSVIVNLEQGRKADMTVTELLLLAKAFKVPAVALIADIEDPFGHPTIQGFEKYHNADLVDLFSLYDGAYGPQIDESQRMSLHMESEGPDDLNLIYFYMNYIASALQKITSDKRDLEKLILRSAPEEEVMRLFYQIWSSKDVLRTGIKGLKKECHIELPQELKEYAERVLKMPLQWKGQKLDELFTEKYGPNHFGIAEQNED